MQLLLFLIMFSFASAEVLVTEAKLEENLRTSPELQEYRRRFESAQKLQGHLTRSFLPRVGLTYGREKFTTGPYDGVNQPFGGIEARMNVFNSGRDRLEGRRLNLEAQTAKVDAEITRVKILTELRKALSHFAYLREVEKILEEALKLTTLSEGDAKKRINAGLATKTDLLDFKQQVIQLGQELQNLRFEKGVTRRMIATLMGYPPTEEMNIEHENSHPEHGQEERLKKPSSKNLLVRKAKLLTEVAEIESSKAKRWWAPEVEVYSYAMRFTQKEREYPELDQRNDVTFGFKIDLPIFDGGEGIAESRSKALLAKAQSQRLLAKNLEVERDTMDAMMKLDLAHGLIHGAEENVEVMESYRRGIKSEYARGVKNSPDVLQAAQRWISAREKFAEVKKNYQFARADALYLMTLSGE